MSVVVGGLWVLFFAAIAWKGWQEWRRLRDARWLFRIRVGGDGVIVDGRVPSRLPAQVREFVARLGLGNGAEIRARRRARGFELVFSAGVSEVARRALVEYLGPE